MRFYYVLLLLFLMNVSANVQAQVNPTALRKAVYAAARCKLRTPPGLDRKIPQALIQLYRPGENTVIGTGFLLRHQQKLFAVFPHHIAGHQGRTWEIQITDSHNNRHRFPISISKHGGFDALHPDLSLTDLSATTAHLPPLAALEMADPLFDRPAFSFGYTIGKFNPDEFLPIKRRLRSQQDWEITTDRVIAGEQPNEPLDIAGYCGAPLVQLQKGDWKVVAMHIGSCVFGPENFHLNRSSAVNLSQAFALLPQTTSRQRSLAFRGIIMDHLKRTEQVKFVEVEREGISIFWAPLKGEADFHPQASEKFLATQIHLQPGDRLIFTIEEGTQQRRAELSVP